MKTLILTALFFALLSLPNCFILKDAGQKVLENGKKLKWQVDKNDFIPIFMDDQVPLKQAAYLTIAANRINSYLGRNIFGKPIYWIGEPPKKALLNTIFVRMKEQTETQKINNRITFRAILRPIKETGSIRSADIYIDLAQKDPNKFVDMLEHEFLHCLGLAHDPELMCSRMHPTISNCYGRLKITNHDLKLLKKLYVK